MADNSNNLLRVGNISSVDVDAGTARVVFDDKDGMVSADLQITYRKTKGDKDYWPFDIDEQVLCAFLPNGLNAGFIIGAVYSKTDKAPANCLNKKHISFKDGTVVEYDREKHEMNISTPGTINISAKQINIKGKIVSVDDITAGGISHIHHVHSGITPGGGKTNEPE